MTDNEAYAERLRAIDKTLQEIDLVGAREWLGMLPQRPRNEAKRAR